MTRPIYEQESDRAKEKDVINQIERRWAAKVDYVIQLPKMSSADIAMVQDNKIVAFGEIKSRNIQNPVSERPKVRDALVDRSGYQQAVVCIRQLHRLHCVHQNESWLAVQLWRQDRPK